MGPTTPIDQAVRALFPLGLFLFAAAGCATPGAAASMAAPLERLDVISEFGRRARGRPHYGVDLRAPSGTPVTAAAAGKVVFTGAQRGFGQIVILQHRGGVQTYYAHLSDFAVFEGLRVEAGELIGFVGATGNASGPHLHFEVRKNGKPRDPLLSISARPPGPRGTGR